MLRVAAVTLAVVLCLGSASALRADWPEMSGRAELTVGPDGVGCMVRFEIVTTGETLRSPCGGANGVIEPAGASTALLERLTGALGEGPEGRAVRVTLAFEVATERSAARELAPGTFVIKARVDVALLDPDTGNEETIASAPLDSRDAAILQTLDLGAPLSRAVALHLAGESANDAPSEALATLGRLALDARPPPPPAANPAENFPSTEGLDSGAAPLSGVDLQNPANPETAHPSGLHESTAPASRPAAADPLDGAPRSEIPEGRHAAGQTTVIAGARETQAEASVESQGLSVETGRVALPGANALTSAGPSDAGENPAPGRDSARKPTTTHLGVPSGAMDIPTRASIEANPPSETPNGPRGRDWEARETARASRSAPAPSLAFGIIVALGASLAFATLARLAREDVLSQEHRSRLLDLLRERPGVTASAAGTLLRIHRTTARYHLLRLESTGSVFSRHVGGARVYFLAGAGAKDAAALASEAPAERILAAVASTPGRRLLDVASDLGLSKQLASYHTRRLAGAGRLRVVAEGRTRRLYPPASAPEASGTRSPR